jgi:hypothetical protein
VAPVRDLPAPLPCEDHDAGLYIHQRSVDVVTISDSAGDRYLVSAEDFMVIQRERDQLRKTLAFLNSVCRNATPGFDQRAAALKLLDDAGFSADDARALDGIMEWARRDRATGGTPTVQ